MSDSYTPITTELHPRNYTAWKTSDGKGFCDAVRPRTEQEELRAEHRWASHCFIALDTEAKNMASRGRCFIEGDKRASHAGLALNLHWPGQPKQRVEERVADAITDLCHLLGANGLGETAVNNLICKAHAAYIRETRDGKPERYKPLREGAD